jgi:hypothetical protein
MDGTTLTLVYLAVVFGSIALPPKDGTDRLGLLYL